LGEAGIAIFPCGANKKPLIKWRDFSSCDANAITQWWEQYPGALPGIDLEKSDLLVLDGDRHGGPDGVAALRELLQQQVDFDSRAAPCARTPNDGVHVYLSQNGHELSNRRGRLPDGVDVRGTGGFVIAPYAVLPDGRQYHPVAGKRDLIEAYRAGTIPFVPQGIVDLIRSRKRANKPAKPKQLDRTASDREKAYARAALKGCAEELSATARGKRNETLNATAYRLGRMVACGWIDRPKVKAFVKEGDGGQRLCRRQGHGGGRGDASVRP
jgi:hypothetical protein